MTTPLFGLLVLVAMLACCSQEAPASSSADPMVGDNDRAAPDAQPIDSVALPEKPADHQPNAGLLTPDGWGPLRIGMTRAEVVAAAGDDANPDAVGGPDPDRCDEFRPAEAPAGILVMIEEGLLTRISVSRTSAVESPEGLRIGDAVSRVLAAYGSRARVEPHQYWEAPAKYVTVWQQGSSGAARRGIRYEIDAAGVVVHLRAGGPSIEYVEGCL